MTNCTVFINTCDKFSFIWNGWNHFHQKYWNKDISWKVCFGTEELSINFKDVENLKIGKLPWGSYVHKAMSMINTDNVFFAMDDHFPVKKINIKLMENMYNYFVSNKIDRLGIMSYYHTLQDPVNSIETNFDKIFYQQTNNSDYLSCLQPSFWRKEFLLSVIEKEWTPWQGEITGTNKIKQMKNINIGYMIENEWYLEALSEGVPRDERFGLDNWKKLTTEHGWKGLHE